MQTSGLYNQAIREGDTIAVKWFRENEDCKVHFFGLGFVQLKLSPTVRYHFYHPKLGSFVENPHDHRYNFFSKVLKGNLHTTIWRECSPIDPDRQPIEIFYTSCQEDGTELEVPDPYTDFVKREGDFSTKAGSSYFMPHEVFHSVIPWPTDGPCITCITRGPHIKEHAKVIKIREEACPYSKKLSEEDLWTAVEECITKGKNENDFRRNGS